MFIAPAPDAKFFLKRDRCHESPPYLRVPVPDRFNIAVPKSVVIVNVADRPLRKLGLNVYWIVQLWPAVSAVSTAQLPLRAKSPGFAPPAVSALIVNVPPPPFVNVTVFGRLVVLIF